MSCEDIPSLQDLQKAKLNADDFGRLMGTGTGTSTNGVTGQVRPTYNAVMANLGYTRVGTFATGATLLNSRQTLLWDVADGGDGQEYGWSGPFPKVVPPGNTPLTTGGIAVGAWISRFDPELRIQVRESLRRSYAEAGFNLVDGSFEAGGVLVNYNDVLLHEATGKGYSGPAGTVTAGTNPTSGWFVDRSGDLLRSQFLKAGGDIRGWGAKCDGVTVDDNAIAAAIADTGGIITVSGPTLVSATVLIEGADRPNVIFTGNGQLLAQKSSFTFHPGTRGILVFKACSNPIAYMPNIRGCRLDLPTAPEPWEDGDAGIEYLNCTGTCRSVHPDLDGFKSWGIIHVGCDSYVVTSPKIRNCLAQSGIGGAGVTQAMVTDPDIRLVGLYGVELETKGLNERSKVSGGIISKSLKAVSCVDNTLNTSVVGVTAEECFTGFSAQSTSGSNLDQGAVFAANTLNNVKFGVELVNSNNNLLTSNAHRNTKTSFYSRTRSYDYLTKVVGTTGYTLDHPISANLTVGMSIELDSGEVRTIASVGAQSIDHVLGAVVSFTTTPPLSVNDARKAFCRLVDLQADSAFCVMYNGGFNGIKGNKVSNVKSALQSFGDHYDLSIDDNTYENVTTILTQGSTGVLVNSSINIPPGCVSGSAPTAVSSSSKFNAAFSFTDTFVLGSVSGSPTHQLATNVGKISKVECILDDNVTATGNIVLKVNGVDTIIAFSGTPKKGSTTVDIDSTGSVSVRLLDTVGDISGSGYSIKLYGAYTK